MTPRWQLKRIHYLNQPIFSLKLLF